MPFSLSLSLSPSTEEKEKKRSIAFFVVFHGLKTPVSRKKITKKPNFFLALTITVIEF